MSPAPGNIQKIIDPFGVNRLTSCLDSAVLGLSGPTAIRRNSLGKAANPREKKKLPESLYFGNPVNNL